MSVQAEPYGVTRRDESASLYRLRNASGMEVALTNYGPGEVHTSRNIYWFSKAAG